MRAKAKEIKLLKKCLKGDAKAFETIVANYQELVCAITYSGVADIHYSEDLAHQTFINAWTKLSQLKDLSKFRPWLCTIARNHVNSFLRKKKRDIIAKAKPMENINDTAADQSGPLESAIKKEHQELVSDAIRHIPEEYREPLVLYYRQQLSIKQIAQALDLSEAVTKKRLQRGRKMVKEQLDSIFEETLSSTGPKKAFTTAVMASVAGMALKGAGVAAAATTAGAATTSTGVTAILSTAVAKIVTAAAVITIGVGAVVTYKTMKNNDASELPTSQTPLIARQDITADDTPPAPTIESIEDNTIARQQPEIIEKQPPTPVEEVIAKSTDQEESTKTEEPTTFEFKPKGVLSGLITDVETGQPVTDATVFITAGPWYKAKTDKNGFYCFDKITVGGNYGIAVHSNEYIGISVYNDQPVVNLKKDGQVVKHFQFPKACMVDVWVVDEEGNGIKNANIVATSPSDSRMKEINRTGSSKKTDKNGYILLGGFKPAKTEYLIAAWHELETKTKREGGSVLRKNKYDYSLGNALVRLTDPNTIKSVQIVLKKGIKVKGYAQYSDGIVASDIKIIARPNWWHCNYGVDGYQVDKDGSFELEYIVPGTYNIGAYTSNKDGSGGSSYTVMQAKLPLPEGELLYVDVPEKSPESLVSISGTLTYVGDKEPGYVEVRAYSPIHGHENCNVGHDNGKLKNRFALNRLEPGQYRITFRGANVEEVVIENIEAPSDDLEVEIVYVSKPRIEFSAMDSITGKPLQKFRARVKKLQTLRGASYVQEDTWYYFSNEDKKIDIEVVGPGTYQIQVAVDGYAPKWSSIINTDKPETAVIELTKGGTVSGKVINEKGEVINGAKVMALSYCGGSKRSTIDVFSHQKDAVETVNGKFVIENLPAGMEKLKVVHPDYTSKIIEDIEIVEGQTTGDIQIVLSKGATIEGYVYDADGKPEEEVILFFQDAFAYGSSENEESSRYGVAVTDSKGYYSVSRLPEKMCYVQRKNKWNALGVILRTVIPKNNKVIKLNFGGKQVLKGTAVIDEVPLSDVKIQLGSVESPHFGNYCSKARTGLDGSFIFRGVIAGKYAIYYERPEKRNDWIKLSNVDIQEDDLDVGIIPGDLSELVVTIDQSSFGKKRVISRVYLSDAEKLFGQPIYMSTSQSEKQGQWFFKGVESSEYLLTIILSDDMQIRQSVSLSEFESEWSIKAELPKSTSSLSGTIIGDASQGIVLWQEDTSVLAVISPDIKGAFKIENLPAGKYVIGSTINLLNGTEGISKFELHSGEELKLDIDLSKKQPDKMAFLQVQVIDDQGKPITDVDIQLKSGDKAVKPMQSTQIGHIFVTVPGDYVLSVEAYGFKTVEKQIKLKPIEMGNPKPKTTIVNLERE